MVGAGEVESIYLGGVGSDELQSGGREMVCGVERAYVKGICLCRHSWIGC